MAIQLIDNDKETKVLTAKELKPFHYYEVVSGSISKGTIIKWCYKLNQSHCGDVQGIVLYSPNDEKFSLFVQEVAKNCTFREVELNITIEKRSV